ncbi:MAG: hypothetical protein Q8O95_01370 [bacterium]|nr:hypothetical protein [bacterium]
MSDGKMIQNNSIKFSGIVKEDAMKWWTAGESNPMNVIDKSVPVAERTPPANPPRLIYHKNNP